MSLILGAETKAAGTPAANSDEANQLLLNGLLLSACSENETSSASTRPGRSNSHAGPPFCNTASEDDVGADRLPRDVSSGVSGYDCKRLDLLLLDEPSLGLAPILGAVRHYRSVAGSRRRRPAGGAECARSLEAWRSAYLLAMESIVAHGTGGALAQEASSAGDLPAVRTGA
jgi:hypothetical protein